MLPSWIAMWFWYFTPSKKHKKIITPVLPSKHFLFPKLSSSDLWCPWLAILCFFSAIVWPPFRLLLIWFCEVSALAVSVPAFSWELSWLPGFQHPQLVLYLFFLNHFWWNHLLSKVSPLCDCIIARQLTECKNFSKILNVTFYFLIPFSPVSWWPDSDPAAFCPVHRLSLPVPDPCPCRLTHGALLHRFRLLRSAIPFLPDKWFTWISFVSDYNDR